MGTQQFSLKWNSHQANMLTVFGQLLSSEALVDVTLACEGLSLKAHKMVLSACSPFFQSLFVENPCTHPIVIMNDMKYANLKAIIDFMYKGEVNVTQDQFAALLKTAETLKVKGLAEVTGVNLQEMEQTDSKDEHDGSASQNIQQSEFQMLPVNRKKRDHRQRRHSYGSSVSDNENNPPKSHHNSILDPLKNVKSEHNPANGCHAAVLSSFPQINISSVHSIQKSLPSLQLHATISSLNHQENSTDESLSNDRNYDIELPGLTRQTSGAKNAYLSNNQELSSVLYPTFSQLIAPGTIGASNRQSLQMDVTVADNHVLVQHSEASVSSCILPNTNQDAKIDGLYEESSISTVAGPSYEENKSKADMSLVTSLSNSNIIEMSDTIDINQSKPVKKCCPVCNRTFKATYLQQHLSLHSSRPMRYSCKICHREFTRHQSLLRHCRTVHSSIKKLCMSDDKYCTICDKVFTNNQNYKVHMMKHRPEEDVSISNTSSDYLLAG